MFFILLKICYICPNYCLIFIVVLRVVILIINITIIVCEYTVDHTWRHHNRRGKVFTLLTPCVSFIEEVPLCLSFNTSTLFGSITTNFTYENWWYDVIFPGTLSDSVLTSIIYLSSHECTLFRWTFISNIMVFSYWRSFE